MNSKALIDTATIQFRFKENEPLDPIPPDNVLSFTYEDTVATSSDKFTCELYDPTWTTLENLIIEHDGIIEFRFGWSKGYKSPWIKASITKHNPTFEMHGLHLSLEGHDESIIANDEAKCRGWVAESYRGKIHNIVKAIADEHGWSYDNESIVDTKEVSDDEGYPKIFVQRQMPDLTFIKDVLLPYAQTPENIGGFRCYYESSKNKLYFKPPNLNAKVSRVYTVYKDRMGQVISFTPDLGNGSLQRQAGALNTRLVGLDPFKKALFDVVVDNKSTTDNKVILGKFMPKQDIGSVGGAGRFTHSATPTEGAALDRARQQWFERFNMFFTAEMEIIGDPTIEPGTTIGVLVLTTNNEPFYCSGKYEIKSVTHALDNGNYTSRLKLEKNAMRQGDINAELLGFGTVSEEIDFLSLSLMSEEEQKQAVVRSSIFVP